MAALSRHRNIVVPPDRCRSYRPLSKSRLMVKVVIAVCYDARERILRIIRHALWRLFEWSIRQVGGKPSERSQQPFALVNLAVPEGVFL